MGSEVWPGSGASALRCGVRQDRLETADLERRRGRSGMQTWQKRNLRRVNAGLGQTIHASANARAGIPSSQRRTPPSASTTRLVARAGTEGRTLLPSPAQGGALDVDAGRSRRLDESASAPRYRTPSPALSRMREPFLARMRRVWGSCYRRAFLRRDRRSVGGLVEFSEGDALCCRGPRNLAVEGDGGGAGVSGGCEQVAVGQADRVAVAQT